MPKSMKTLLADQINNLYSAENQVARALPVMARSASNEHLRVALEQHLEETGGQAERLTRAAQILTSEFDGKVCKGMRGLLDEGREVAEEGGDANVIDAALIAVAQRIEYYEIAAYTTAEAIAEQLGETEIVQLLQATLYEEFEADEVLSDLLRHVILPAPGAMVQPSGHSHPAPQQGAR
ncbi:MAG TPA: ferritin-like domain-containing protein [Phycisphaerales bacterium]|nr:ferritin-like domain-containing protein [Phycisphaerales bacterium]